MARHPIPELLTPRLRLRAFRAGDAPDFHAAYGDAETMRYWDHAPSPSVVRTERYISHWAQPSPEGWMSWAVARADTDRCIGMVNYHARSTRHRRAEIGYILAPAAVGQGYAREGVGALIGHMRSELQVHRIEAEIDARNARSRVLVERLGFALEAPLMRDRLRGAEGYVDAALYALVAG
ncbi:MAG: GNAT family N-acetyltransferase [Rhodospirillales bacterium]|nr:GNAT family N-acetyltransferase [Rhodospirillales bacterium]MDE2573796.1 GNAT family N-acetyltransferase [Rhodospirillales bacterium]